jgi:hypothetical protein
MGAALMQDGCAHDLVTGAGRATAAESPPPPLPDQSVIDQVVNGLDRRLAWIDRQQLPAHLTPYRDQPVTPEDQARIDAHTRLFRQSVRTLYVTGRFMDLPDEIKTHPAVQSRVAAAQPEMDDAVRGMTDLLESLRPEDHRAIQATLRSRRDLGEELAQILDNPAKEDGIPFARRMSVRQTALRLADRMTTQSPALTIDPYVRRVRKIEARPPADGESARRFAARMGEEAFWQHQQRLGELSARWQRQLAQAAPTPYPGPPPPAPATRAPAPVAVPATPSSGTKVLTTGGYIMGFGAASVGVGLLLAGIGSAASTHALAMPALIFGVTVGPILLVVGLLVVIVGGIMKAAE